MRVSNLKRLICIPSAKVCLHTADQFITLIAVVISSPVVVLENVCIESVKCGDPRRQRKKRSISLSHSGLNTAHVTRSWSAAHSRRRVITDRMEHWQQLSIYDRLCGALPMCTVTTVFVWYVAAMGYAINKAKNFQTIIYVLTKKKASKSAYGLLAFEVSFRITNDRAVKRNGAKAVWISNDAKI